MLRKIFFIGTLFFIWVQSAVATVEKKEAEAFMIEIGEKVVNLLTDKSISTQDRTEQFREILQTKFNVKAIGKFVLGRYWKQSSDEEKQQFLELFETTIASSYATRFKDYTSEKFEVVGSRSEKDGGVTVLTQITRPNGQTIPIDWKIFEKKGELRIYDVILEGISMSITQRSEYASVIQHGGEGTRSLIKALQKKSASYQREHPTL